MLEAQEAIREAAAAQLRALQGSLDMTLLEVAMTGKRAP